MILYLAGLKGVDPSIKEAAAIDGASERQIFFRVVFPAMRPINIVGRGHHDHRVVTGLRHRLRLQRRHERAGTAGCAHRAQNLLGEGQDHRYRVGATRSMLLVISLVPIVIYLSAARSGTRTPRDGIDTDAAVPHAADLDPVSSSNAKRPCGNGQEARYGTQICSLSVMAVVWLIPLLWTMYTSVRPRDRHQQVKATGACRTRLTLQQFLGRLDAGWLRAPRSRTRRSSRSRPCC